MGENLGYWSRRALAREPRGAGPMEQHDLLIKIRETPHGDLVAFARIRDLGLIPNPAASPLAIKRAEKRLRRTLPPSYRAFLRLHDGWPRFFDGASLLGTATLGHAASTRTWPAPPSRPPKHQVPDLGPPRRPRARSLIPFGADLEGTTLFAFNPAVVQPDGEYEVIAWGQRAWRASAKLPRVPGVHLGPGRPRHRGADRSRDGQDRLKLRYLRVDSRGVAGHPARVRTPFDRLDAVRHTKRLHQP